MTETHVTKTLVIAYGNRLRGDDGVGLAAVEVVESWQLPGVAVKTVQQLVPELIAEMKGAERVLFVDAAAPGSCTGPFASARVEAVRTRQPLEHFQTPANLMALLQDLEGCKVQACLVKIAGEAFGHGEQITAIAQNNMHEALTWIRQWLLGP